MARDGRLDSVDLRDIQSKPDYQFAFRNAIDCHSEMRFLRGPARTRDYTYNGFGVAVLLPVEASAMNPAIVRNRSSPRKSLRKVPEWNLRHARGIQILEAPSLSQLDWIAHGFSTRPGGVSELESIHDGRRQSERVLNLGFTEWDSRERVLTNRRNFFEALHADKMSAIGLRQIHSDIVRVVNPADANPSVDAAKADALITNEPGLLLLVQVADCVPILLADKKRRAIAAIHSGWRGTLQRIAEKTLGRMQMEYGTRPRDVIAALGPGIGQCCFEVGPEVAAEYAAKFPEAREWFQGPFDSLARGDNDPNWLPWLTMRPPGHQPPSPRVRLDLIAANRSILSAAGVQPGNIFSSGFCTACRTDLFFSYRRERVTGRMMAAIGIRPS
jgi:polyphenol oxidase